MYPRASRNQAFWINVLVSNFENLKSDFWSLMKFKLHTQILCRIVPVMLLGHLICHCQSLGVCLLSVCDSRLIFVRTSLSFPPEAAQGCPSFQVSLTSPSLLVRVFGASWKTLGSSYTLWLSVKWRNWGAHRHISQGPGAGGTLRGCSDPSSPLMEEESKRVMWPG